MQVQPLIYGYLDDFLSEIRSKGRYAFSLDEVKIKFNLSDKALNQALYRLKFKKRIAQIRKGFYAILSPEYARQGMVPPSLFIDDMMKSLDKRYYVGLLSAAALHGAAHQQPMEYFVVTEKPALRNIRNKKLKINFFVKKDWRQDDLEKKKTDAGYINISSPEFTALDLLFYIESVSISQTLGVLKELASEMQNEKLTEIAKSFPQTAAIQRLGYLLEYELSEFALADALHKILITRNYFPIQLSPKKNKIGELVQRWKVFKNITLENDL
ncbi:MAG TPA: type IV toxin-antitoxin system AbiEi family antitoxin [Mucilaginibacter sp.]|jgi:predicted transcriptional regulator of viral defense system|nr:type IV toxin-antitoxin system AbiEi family antitoxin [Mucilaginibacter sp.]